MQRIFAMTFYLDESEIAEYEIETDVNNLIKSQYFCVEIVLLYSK
jgi:hypothetical protein